MAYVAIGGYIVATSPAAVKILRWLARRPAGGRSTVVFVGVLSIGLSLLNWGLSLIFSGLLVREMARRRELILDYRAQAPPPILDLVVAASRWACHLRRHNSKPIRQASHPT
jgi:short-chain fatty acids transporter